MRFYGTTLLLAAYISTTALANPIPAANFNEIEKRWAEGQNEVCPSSGDLPSCYFHAWIQSVFKFKAWAAEGVRQQIHNGLTHRDMTPSWPMHALSDEEGFATATDERSIAASYSKSQTSMVAQLKEFAERIMRSKGLNNVIAREEVAGHAVVLRPRKEVRYYFTK